MQAEFLIYNRTYTLAEVLQALHTNQKLRLSPDQQGILDLRRNQLDSILLNGDNPIYGVNTGFGALCNTVIADEQLTELQCNLVRSHACGFGDLAPDSIVRLCLFLKILCLSQGYSGVRSQLINFLIDLYNHNFFPQIPIMGSLGASGDLAPLAHLSLPCIGEGKIRYNNQVYESLDLLNSAGIKIPMLKAKEGLALLNGTQFSLSLLLDSLFIARQSFHLANMIGACSLEAFNGQSGFLHPKIHEIRRQNGQIQAATEMRAWISSSDLPTRPGKAVQDPYSFRCAPQVHGASLDVIQYVETIATNEINAVSDNPLLISDYEIVSGGNFHAQPIALASDFLGIALSELAQISERRLYQLICGHRGLPDFLTSTPGLHSGYMIVQYAAAAAVSLNKQLSTPSSVDSIISSKGQEDHVSMAANAGIKCRHIARNTQTVLAMEWMTACRALKYRNNLQINPVLSDLVKKYLVEIPFIEEDHIPSDHYEQSTSFLYALNFPHSIPSE